MLSSGQIIDRYEVLEELGQGACAVVYRVRHTRLGSDHALKLLLRAPTALRARLEREGQIQARLRHPNIVPVTDVVDFNGMTCLIMDCVAGPDLDAWCRSHRPDLAVSEQLFRGILSGLTHAHRLGIIHRDLKPSNVLIDTVNDQPLPRISDFGIAKEVENEVALTRSRASMGTPRYMAPEQWRDSRSVDARADIFSMGCMLYELISGQAAFPADNLPDIYAAASTGTYTDPGALLPTCPPHLRAAILGCLQPDPQRRIPDCDALLRVLDGKPWALPAPTLAPPIATQERPAPTLASRAAPPPPVLPPLAEVPLPTATRPLSAPVATAPVAAAVPTAPPATATFAGDEGDTLSGAAWDAPPQRQHRWRWGLVLGGVVVLGAVLGGIGSGLLAPAPTAPTPPSELDLSTTAPPPEPVPA